MTDVHVFDPANQQDDADFWAVFYRQAFVDYEAHEVVTDVEDQKAGIDHRVRLRGGGELLIDCKTRDKFYEDVLVEVWSDVERHTKGWALKPLRCHYIAYAFPQVGVCYLLPFHLLRRAYEDNKQDWKDAGLRVVNAANRGYTTRSVAVPADRLRAEIGEAMTVYFPGMEPF